MEAADELAGRGEMMGSDPGERVGNRGEPGPDGRQARRGEERECVVLIKNCNRL